MLPLRKVRKIVDTTVEGDESQVPSRRRDGVFKDAVEFPDFRTLRAQI